MELLLMLLISGCAGAWRLLPGSTSSVYEFTNATGAFVQCDWKEERASGGELEPVARQSGPIWLDASGQPVNSIPGLRQVLSNGTMVLLPFRGDAYRPDVHSTEYRCLVPAGSNAGNSQSFALSPPIVVRSVVIGALQVYASDAYALPGNSAVLTCLLLPADQSWAVEVTHWTVSSSASTSGHLVDSHQPAQGGSKYAVIDGHLHVADVTVEDTRMAYRCHARHRLNAAGRAVSSPPARIVMKGIVDDLTHPFQQPLDDLPDGGTAPLPPVGPPRLVAPGRRVVHVKLGQDVAYLTCRIVAHPPAKIRWFKVNPANGAAMGLTNDGTVRRMAVSGDWLQLRHVSAEDAGRYRCQASNAHGQVEAEFQLEVVGRMSVSLEPKRQVAGVDEPVEWTCNVSGLLSGQAAPLVRWTRNGVDVAPDSSRFYFPQPNVLRINQAAAQDAGVYQCFARTPVANGEEVHANAELVVRDFPPRLASVFSEQTVHSGRSAFLHCFATGNPPPSVVWSVDSLPFTYTSGRASVSRQVDDNIHRSYLNISSAEVEDGGLYCCSLREPPNQQHCARLNVYGPVSVRWASNRTAVAGQDYALHCPYSGYPILSVSWYRYSQIIKENDKYKIAGNGTLRISNADPVSDSGEYTCIVKGTASSTAKQALYLDVIRPPVIEPFSFPVQVQEGGRAQVTCAISAGDLPIEVTWLRDGKPIANHLGVEVQTGEFHSLLIFKKLRGEHSGVYTCTARNLASTASRAATLLVQVPPKWMVEPQDAFPLENHPVKIPCRVHAVPVPSVLWYRVDGQNHQMMHPTNNVVMLSDGSIQFNRITKSDEGFLQCRATNNIGQPLSKTIRMNVNAGAKVRIQSSGSILPSGSEAVLRCEVSGDPPLTVHWKRFDQLISSIDRYQLSMTSPSAANKHRTLDLNISRIEADDAGTYICQAANAYGSDAAEIHLVVQELPKAPGKLQLTSVQSRSAEVQWLDDDVDPLLHYRVQLIRPGTGWTFNYTVEAGRNLVTLPHLHPFTSYQVLVYAINSAGVGPPSAALEFQTLEEAPSGSPRHVLAEAKSSRSLLVSWLPPQEDSWNGRLVTFSVTCLESGTGRIAQRSLAFVREPARPVRRVQVLIDDLRPATVYTVTVRAWNRMGSGPESEPISLGTPEAAPASAPVSVQCSAQSSDAIHVSWSHPAAGELHGHLLGFRIVYKMLPSASSPSEALLSASKRVGNTLESVLYGLHAFQNYSIQVSAVNRAGNGPPSVPVVCQTEETAPNVVNEIKAASVSGSSILVAWRRPVPSNGRISHYVVMVKDTKTGEMKRFVYQANRNLTFHVGNLVEGRSYDVSVTAASRTGESSPSKTVSVSPTARSGAKILEFSRSVHVDEHQTDCVLACPATEHTERTWTLNGQPLATNPALNYREGRDGSLHLFGVDRSAEGDYACTVRNAHGRDAVVYSVQFMRVPEAPQLSVTPTSTSSIRISWSKTQQSTRPPVLELVVLYRPANNPESIAQEKVIDANDDGTVLEGLLCGTQYEVQIQARNAVGFGPKSPVIRAMTRGSGPTLPEVAGLFGTTSSLPGTLFLHLDHWPTGGCRIGYIQVERKGPVRLLSSDGADSWNTLASNVNPDDQPMLKISDFIAEETYHLRLTAASDAGVQIAAYLVRRTTNKNSQTGSHFDVQPMMLSSSSLAGPGNGYESLIVIASMSISGLMLAFSIAAIGYVFHKRKQYRASSSTKSEYSLRTVAEQLDNNEPAGPAPQVHARPRTNGTNAAGSTYSLRKQVDPEPADVDDVDDDDITPYATFTLKPICGMDTVRSLMSVPTMRAVDSHSPNSIEADVYGHQHPTLPCMTMLANGHLPPPPAGLVHPHSYRHLNRSPVPPYRSSDASSAVYSDTYSSKNVIPSPTARWNNNKKPRNPNHRAAGEAAAPRLPSHFSEFRYIGDASCDANKFRF